MASAHVNRVTTPAFVICLLIACASKDQAPSNNRLARASSPYLREHADNPVDWYEWGDEALSRAQREGKPLLISIGYAACHWCHVMEAESFMDTAVARIMNEKFISIKIDREERPDIDAIYINAAQLISGNAGWPLNAFALPDGRPFYASTYFPKEQWILLLNQVAESYETDERSLRKQAAEITKGVRSEEVNLYATDSVVASTVPQRIFENWSPFIDQQFGGLHGAPKFPLPVIWEYMLQHHYLTNDKLALQLGTTTLNSMSRGGIYDHLRGGFARYSTDSTWRVPHFEKMLYDNAQLVKLYAQAYQVTQEDRYETVVRESLAFIREELTSADGLFYASINADSEGEEGTFYVWSRTEIDEELNKVDADIFSSAFNVTAGGNWESGKNVLYRSERAPGDPKAAETLDQLRRKLLKARNERVHPSTDDKLLTSWNAMMIEGYLQAYAAFGDSEYLSAATKAAGIIQKDRIDAKGHVWRTRDSNHQPIEGFLDDYAFLCRAYIRLYQSSFDIQYLTTARLLADFALTNFYDETSGLFFYSLDQTAQKIAKKIEVADEVMPSSNAALAECLYMLGEYFQDDRYARTCEKMISSISSRLLNQGPFYASWARLKELMESKPFEVAIVGADADRKRLELMKTYLPTAIVCGGDTENLPLLENKTVAGKTMIYVCRNRVCKFPVENVDEALKQLQHAPQKLIP